MVKTYHLFLARWSRSRARHAGGGAKTGGFIEGEESDQIEGWDYKKREKRRDSAKKMAEGYLSTSEGHSQRQRRLSARVSFKKEAGKWTIPSCCAAPIKNCLYVPILTQWVPQKTPRPGASHYKSISRGYSRPGGKHSSRKREPNGRARRMGTTAGAHPIRTRSTTRALIG